MTSRRLFKFSAPGNKSMPELSPERKPNPEVVNSGESDFESATESPTPEPTRRLFDIIEGKPQVDIERTERTEFVKYLEGGPQDDIEEHNLLVESSYFTEPRPNPPYSPLKNLFSTIQRHNQPVVQTLTMAQPANGSKELNHNKPEPFNKNRDSFKKFLQNVEVYMDVNHETYNNDLRKIVFILSFMATGSAATWKAQFIDEAYARPAPPNPNDRLGTYTQFRKNLMEAFSMFDSLGDVLDELQSLRKKKTESINEHIAKFKMLAAKSKIDTTNFLTIELFKETLPWGLTLQLMKLETPLKTIADWYEWAAELDHKHAKINQAIERTRGTGGKDKTPQKKYYFPRQEHDPNAMDVDRLTIEERDKLLKEGKCFKCRKTGHQANKCPEEDNNKKKGKEVPKKKMNRRKLHAHVRALFKEMMEEDRDEFLKGAEEAGF
jgi:Ty3 transposon capsid-like protein/Zinc knuckle